LRVSRVVSERVVSARRAEVFGRKNELMFDCPTPHATGACPAWGQRKRRATSRRDACNETQRERERERTPKP